MSYAFTFDARACTGCKACQEACKDKNELPAGILWRRVIEVTGGEWRSTGQAWENNVFAYNLALACNHCTHPKCAGVCPTDAYIVRPDGIVMLDASRCMGCGYCAWACPYGAPQYDARRGIMTKCDFCYDNIDAGLPPSCVAACSLRVLNYSTLEQLGTLSENKNLWQLPASEHPFPLPNYSRTEPHLAIKPHPGMHNPLEKAVGNREEILPPQSFEYRQGSAALHELPLLAFTLLAQMAAGLAVCNLVISLPLPLLLTIGILLAAGGSISFLHLGRKRNAWRAITHLKKSWLSRELLMFGLFGIAWAVTVARSQLTNTPLSPWLMAVLGGGLVYCMGRVYRLRAVPQWNSWRTPAAFFLSALSLGPLGANLGVPKPWYVYIAGFALLAEMALMLISHPPARLASNLRLALLGLGILGTLVMAINPAVAGFWMALLVFLISMVEEAIGRWQFYASRAPYLLES